MNATPKIQCPTCRRMFEPILDSSQMPFCSVRCKMADLNRWFNEDVGLPVGSSEPEDEEEEPAPPPQTREWKFD
jgi:uncharacterized protein